MKYPKSPTTVPMNPEPSTNTTTQKEFTFMIIELHIIQNFAPSCLNRDDLNAPKDCEFGGLRRARISSQSLKRATRWNPVFKDSLSHSLGIRTRRLAKKLAEYFVAKGRSEQDALKVTWSVLKERYKGKNHQTEVGLYIGIDEIEMMVHAIEPHFEKLLEVADEVSVNEEDEVIETGKPAKKQKKGTGNTAAQDIAKEINKDFKPGTKAADIALFGRMIAKATNFNVDAAAQVAHAISTHGIPSEFDFFTAVDDLQPKGDPGAGMMGTQQFNSATFYRYANVHLPQLCTNLGCDVELAREAALAFVHSFICSIPSAKQNSHAAHNPPDLVLAVVRARGQALSLANAFVRPVDGKRSEGLVGDSGKRLAEYWGAAGTVYTGGTVAAAPFFTVAPELKGIEMAGGTRVSSLDAMLGSIRSAISTFQCPEKKEAK